MRLHMHLYPPGILSRTSPRKQTQGEFHVIPEERDTCLREWFSAPGAKVPRYFRVSENARWVFPIGGDQKGADQGVRDMQPGYLVLGGTHKLGATAMSLIPFGGIELAMRLLFNDSPFHMSHVIPASLNVASTSHLLPRNMVKRMDDIKPSPRTSESPTTSKCQIWTQQPLRARVWLLSQDLVPAKPHHLSRPNHLEFVTHPPKPAPIYQPCASAGQRISPRLSSQAPS